MKMFLFGGILLLIVLVAAVLLWARWNFQQNVQAGITTLWQQADTTPSEPITEAIIEHLPEPVQKHLRAAGVIGKPPIRTVWLKQRGQFKMKPGSAWMPFEAEEYYSVNPPAFLWHARIKMAPLCFIHVRDNYTGGRGGMFAKLAALVPLFDESGEKLDQGTLLRFLNEIFWFPSAYLADYIEWEAIDATSAKATMTYKEVSASAILTFNEQGDLLGFVADRYREVEGDYHLETWSTPVGEYRKFNGYRIPSRGEGVWKLEDGDFTYFKGEVVEIHYNTPFPQL